MVNFNIDLRVGVLHFVSALYLMYLEKEIKLAADCLTFGKRTDAR